MPCCRESPWRGYRPPLEPPVPAAGTFLGRSRAAAVSGRPGSAGRRPGGQGAGALASDPRDGLAAALARLGQAFMARNA
jgi:hypothetical protein